jgi:hypothetical protein
MEYSTKITDAKKGFSLADNESFIDVSFNILDEEGNVVAERKLGFPVDTPEDEIRETVKKNGEMYQKDHETAAEAETRAEAEKVADETISNLVKE